MTHRVSGTLGVWFLILGTILCLGVFVSSPVRAQVVGATINGTITDNSGAVIPNAQISIKAVATGVVRDLTADAAGFYTAPNLDAGSYELTVKAMGFKLYVQSGITLTVGAQQTLNISMQVGEVSQTVSVTTDAPVVQLTSSSIGSLVGESTVVELPLNGRDWGALANLAPGVAAVQVQQATGATVPKGNRGYGNQMTIAGTRPQMNNYRQDGVSVVDYSGGTPASVIALTLGVDAIAEFSVTTSNHSAEYGRTSGGVINAITKSGTNQFHGDAYWFIRDEGFDARGGVDPAGTLPPFHRNQMGGSVGGPILKQKTFFFTNVELFRQTRTTSNIDTVPSVNARNGILSTGAAAPVTSCPAGYTDRVPGQSNICMLSTVIPFLSFFPVPTTTLTGGDLGTVAVGIPTVGSENYYTARIDHTINSKDSLTGSFFIDNATFSQPDIFLTTLSGNTSGRRMVTAAENHIFSPSFLNSIRVGYSRQDMVQNHFLQCLLALACDTSGVVTAVPGRPAPGITITNESIFAGGAHALTANSQIWNSYQLYDDAFWTKGTHSMKIGFVAENMRHGPSNVQTLNSGWFFPSLAAFLEDTPQVSGLGPQSIRLPAASYGYPLLRQTLFGGYFQDDWKFRPNLTLNLGLRYEAATVMSEPNGNLQNLACITCSTPIIGNPLYQNPTLRNFEPRLGFAWDPFKDGKSSIRGAFGVFDVLPLIMEFFTAAQSSAPAAPPLIILNQSQVQSLDAAQGKNFPVLPTPSPSGGTTIDFTQPNPRRNYVMVWNLSFQRQLTANTSVTVGYVANRGVHMAEQFGTLSVDQPLGFDAAGYPYWPGGTGIVNGSPKNLVGTGTLINPAVSSERGILWDGDSHYRSLEVSVDKKFSHGFLGQAGYTWSDGTDTSSALTISDPFLNSISTLWWFCKVCRTGPTDFNIGKKATGSLIWDIPSPSFGGSFGSHVLGGWELGTIVSVTTGTPFSILIGGDPEGTNSSDSPNSVFPNYTPGCNPVNPGNKVQYVNYSCFTLPTAPAGSNIPCSAFGAKSDGTGGVAGTCANLQGNAGRNMLTGPGLFDIDFSVIKNTKVPRISETFNMQFRVEMFNVINHPSWQAPITPNLPTAFSATGAPTPASSPLTVVTVPGREIQFGLKAIF